jgi:hypothetical protein
MDRRLSFRLNKAATCGFKVRGDDPLADTLLEGHCLVKAYWGGVLKFIGDVVTADEVSTDQQQSASGSSSRTLNPQVAGACPGGCRVRRGLPGG